VNTQSSTDERLQKALRSLPSTVSGITNYLISEGIQGSVADAACCPLAIWLSSKVGYAVRVGTRKAWVPPSEGVALPLAVAMFAEQFDLNPEMPRRGVLIL